MLSMRWVRLAVGAYSMTTLHAAAIASADPAPLPPLPVVPGYPPPGLLAAGVLGRPYGYPTFWTPIPPGAPLGQWDAAGIGIGTNADSPQASIGMPGSRLGASPTRLGPNGPAPGVRTSSQIAAGVSIGAIGRLESVDGQPLPTQQAGNEAVLLAPALGP